MFKRYEIFKFKLQVVKFAWESNNYAAGCEFCINEKLVCDWQKQAKKLKCMPKNKCCNHKKQCQWPELKDKLLCWIKEQRQWLHRHLKHGHHQGEGNGHQNSDNRVPGLQPVVYEVPSMEESCSLTEEKDCPKVSRRSWPEDYKLPQLRHQEQKEAKLQTCPHLQHGQNACLVLTCHQPKPWIGNGKGEKTVLVNTTGHKKSQFAVVLVCLADGTKPKSMVIFKQKKLPKENFPPRVLIHCHLKGWMDEVGMKLWIEKVWQSWLCSLLRKKSLLVWDSFQAHLVDSLKWAVHQTENDIAVILRR